MEQYLPVLEKTRLFAGVDEDEIGAMLGCLGAKLHLYEKGSYVLRQGDTLNRLMVLAEGRMHIRKDDYWGNRSIISAVQPGDMVGEAYLAPRWKTARSSPLISSGSLPYARPPAAFILSRFAICSSRFPKRTASW